MKNKILKGLYCLAIILFGLGAISLVPCLQFINGETEASDKVFEYQTWDGKEKSVVVQAVPTPTKQTVAGKEFVEIGDIDTLRYVSYMTATDATWCSKNYMLTADINGEGGIWTPIGAFSSKPFTGMFYGNGYTISNLFVMEDDGLDAFGFFGHVGNSSTETVILNLTLENFTYFDVDEDSTGDKVGSLIGSVDGKTVVVDCATANDGKYFIKSTEKQIKSIGARSGNLYIYRGGTQGRRNVDKSIAKTYKTKVAIDSTLTLASGVSATSTGYAIKYNIGKEEPYFGQVYYNTKETSVGAGYYYTALVTSSGTGLTDGSPVSFSAFYGNIVNSTSTPNFIAREGFLLANEKTSFTSSELSSLYNEALVYDLTGEDDWNEFSDLKIVFKNGKDDEGFTASEAYNLITATYLDVVTPYDVSPSNVEELAWTVENVNPEKGVKIRIELKDGYQLKNTESGIGVEAPTEYTKGVYLQHKKVEVMTVTNPTGDQQNYEISLPGGVGQNAKLVGDGTIYLAVERKTFEIQAKYDAGGTLIVSDNTAYTVVGEETSDEEGHKVKKLTTRIGEGFTITTTANNGYKFSVKQHTIKGEIAETESTNSVYKVTATTVDYGKDAGWTYEAYTQEVTANIHWTFSYNNKYTDSVDADSQKLIAFSKDNVDRMTAVNGNMEIPIKESKATFYIIDSKWYDVLNDATFVIKKGPAEDSSVALSASDYTYDNVSGEVVIKNAEETNYYLSLQINPQNYNVTYQASFYYSGEYHQITDSYGLFTIPTDMQNYPGQDVNYDYQMSSAHLTEFECATANASGHVTIDYNNPQDLVVSVSFRYKVPTFSLNKNGFVISPNTDGVGTETGMKLYSSDASLVTFKNASATITTATIEATQFTGVRANDLGAITPVSIDLPTGYYFIGWYLRNGDTYIKDNVLTIDKEVSLTGLVSNEKTISGNITITPILKQKTLTLKFYGGEDDYSLVNQDAGNSAVKAATYYHRQEQYGGSAFRFSSITGWKKIGASGVKSWTPSYDGFSSKTFDATSGTLSVASITGDIYASANSFDVTFEAVWNYIKYSVRIDANKSLTISLNQALNMSVGSKGEANYAVGEATVTSSKTGYTAQGFKIENANGVLEGDDTPGVKNFDFSEANIKSYLVSENYYSLGSGDVFTVTTYFDANEYKVYISYKDGPEQLTTDGLSYDDSEGKYYVMATFDQNITALESVKFARRGYTLSGWRETNATGNTSGSQYISITSGVYTHLKKMQTPNNIYVKAMWQRDNAGDFYGITFEVDSNAYFINTPQVVARATVKAGETEITYSTTQTLDNGEQIAKFYWRLADSATDATSSSRDLSLLNAGTYNYEFVVKIKDTIGGDTYEVVKKAEQIEILKNTFVMAEFGQGAEEYSKWTYTGISEVFANTSDRPQINFTVRESGLDKTPAKDGFIVWDNGLASGADVVLKNVNVYIIDEEEKYDVADGKLYYLRYLVTAVNNINLSNLTSLECQSTEKIAQLEKATVYVDVTGQGYYTGTRHTLNFGKNVMDFNATSGTAHALHYRDTFDFSITLQTSDIGNAGSTTQFSGKQGFTHVNADNWVTKDGKNVSANFELDYVTGKHYDIVPVGTDGVTREFKVKNIGLASDGDGSDRLELNDNYNGYTLRLINLSINNSAESAFVETAQEYHSTKVSIVGNNSKDLIIVYPSSTTVSYTIKLIKGTGDDERFVFLGFKALSDTPNIASYFSSYTKSDASETSLVNPTSNQMAIFSQVKQLNLNGNGGLPANVTRYVVSGSSISVANPARVGFVFKDWSVPADRTGLTVSGNNGTRTLNQIATSNYISSTLTAEWSLADIDTSAKNSDGNTIKRATSETGVTISTADVLTINNYDNSNTIQYTYTWKKSSSQLGTGTTYTFLLADVTQNGDYTLVVTASYNGEQKISEMAFKMLFVKLHFDSVELVQDTITYNAKERNNEVQVRVTYSATGIEGSQKTDTLTLATGLIRNNYKFILSGQDSSIVKDAGSYTIALSVTNTEIFETSEITANLTVNEFAHRFTASELNDFSAYQYQEKSEYNLVRTFSWLGEEVVVTFDTVADKSSDTGHYKLSIISYTHEENYDLSLDESNNYFEILEPVDVLAVEFEAFTNVYDGKTYQEVTFELRGDTYYVKFHANDGSTLEKAVKVYSFLLTFDGEDRTENLADNLATAFDGYTFALNTDAKNVGRYNIVASKSGSSQTFEGGVEFRDAKSVKSRVQFEITRRDINVTKVEREFNTLNTFETKDVTVESGNVLEGDEVFITGSFNNEHVDTNKSILFNALSGRDANNYQLVDKTDSKGTIIKSKETVELSLSSDDFVYGTISEDMDASTLAHAISLIVTAGDGYTGAVNDEYITLSIVSIVDATYSTSKMLEVKNGYVVTFTLISNEYEDVGAKMVTINVTPKDLDLSKTVVTKEYDGTTVLPSEVDWVFDGKVGTDNLSVNKGGAYYQRAGIAQTIKINGLTLGGDDACNYNLLDNVYGNIVGTTFSFKVDYLNVDPTQPGQKWVDEDCNDIDKSVTGKLFFTYEYSGDEFAEFETKFNNENTATRLGYTHTGYYFDYKGSKLELNEDNFDTFITEAGKNKTEGFTLYAKWQIQEVEISFSESSYLNGTTIKIKGPTDMGTTPLLSGKAYRYQYFSKIELTIETASGYKITAFTPGVDNVVNLTGNELGKRTMTPTFNVVRGGAYNVATEALVVTVTYNEGLHENAQLTTGQSTQQIEYTFDSLPSTQVPSISVEEGTYTFAGWKVTSGGEVWSSGSLRAFLDSKNTDYDNGDIEVEFTAQWTAITYTVRFSVNNVSKDEVVTIESGEEIQVDFNSKITFPHLISTVDIVPIWTLVDGETNMEVPNEELDDYKLTYHKSAPYEIEFVSEWVYAKFEITVKIEGGNIRAQMDGEEVTSSGKTVKLQYGTDELSVETTVSAGYETGYSLDPDGTATVTIENGTVKLSNPKHDATLTIRAVPKDNTLQLDYENCVVSVEIDNVNTELQGNNVVAKTGTRVKITFTANPGYEFTQDGNEVVWSVGGTTSVSYSSDKVVCEWSDFTDGGSLTIRPTAKLNTIAIKGDNILSVRGATESEDGWILTARTGTTLQIVVTMKYGYDSIQVTLANGSATLDTQDPERQDASHCVAKTITATEFTDGFEINVSSSPRIFNIKVVTNDEGKGSAQIQDVGTSGTITFGGNVKLVAKPINNRYVFTSWIVGEITVASGRANAEYTFTINDETYKEYLENVDGMTITARFINAIEEMTISVGPHGSADFKAEIKQTNGTISAGNQGKFAVDPEDVITITIHADAGYTIDTVEYLDIDNEQIENSTWFNGNVVYIDLVNGEAVQTINITFKQLDLKVRVETYRVVNTKRYQNDNGGGTIEPCQADGTLFEEGQGENGSTYLVESKTDNILYFLVTVKANYSIKLSTSGNEYGASIEKTDVEKNGGTVWKISGIKGKGQGLEYDIILEADFIASIKNIKIYLTDGKQENDSTRVVEAGEIVVNGDSSDLAVVGNYTPSVLVSAIFNNGFTFTVRTNFSYVFNQTAISLPDGSKVFYSISDGIEFSVRETDEGTTIGGAKARYCYIFTITNIEKLVGDGTIMLFMTPKVYNVRLVDFVGDDQKEVEVYTIENVVYGEPLLLDGVRLFTSETQSKNGRFEFFGYFTEQLGGGRHYIGPEGELGVRTWKEQEFIEVAGGYQMAPNFDGNRTFTLYAFWVYNKQIIEVSFVPEQLDSTENLNITSFVVSLGNMPYWQPADDKLRAEIDVDKNVVLEAKNMFDGYIFRKWILTDDKDYTQEIESQRYTFTSTVGIVKIQAVYFASFNVTAYKKNTNTVFSDAVQSLVVKQGGQVVDPAIGIDTDNNAEKNTVTIEFVENAGYVFQNRLLYESGVEVPSNEYRYDYSKETGISTITFVNPVTNPLNIRLEFEGRAVNVRINKSRQLYEGDIIEGVWVNNEQKIDYTAEEGFRAFIGDVIRIQVGELPLGYERGGVKFEGKLDFHPVDRTTWQHQLISTDYTNDAEIIDVYPVLTRNDIDYLFNVSSEAVKEGMYSWSVFDAGEILYKNVNIINPNTRIEDIPYGEPLTLTLNLKQRFAIKSVIIDGVSRNVEEIVQGNRLTISPSQNTGNVANVQIVLQKLLWTDDIQRLYSEVNFETYSLAGAGTPEDPYVINTARDMAFVAWAVNSGRSKNGVEYASARYVVSRSLDFGQMFWEPIGTYDHPFDGVIDFGSRWFSDLHVYDSSIETHYGGLIGVLGKNGKVLRSNTTWWIVLVVIASVIATVLFILLILFLYRRYRRKKMEQLANG